jgi:hypothetical protein
MSVLSSPNFLRNVLWADAASCLGSGLLQVLLTGVMASMLGLPAALLSSTGLFLLVYAAAVGFIATRRPLPRAVIWLLVVGNLGWALACVEVLISNWATVTVLGTAYVLVQALTVAVLAELQWFGLRRAAAGPSLRA